MCPRHLEQLLLEDKQRGLSPFFVNCTSGTTVYGAFDPINAIADICQKYGLWLHIDVRSDNCLLKCDLNAHCRVRLPGAEVC